MALIEKMEREHPNKPKVDNPVHRATYSISNIGGATFLKIRTFGSDDRVHEDVPSQVIQLGPEGIAQLKEILGKI